MLRSTLSLAMAALAFACGDPRVERLDEDEIAELCERYAAETFDCDGATLQNGCYGSEELEDLSDECEARVSDFETCWAAEIADPCGTEQRTAEEESACAFMYQCTAP